MIVVLNVEQHDSRYDPMMIVIKGHFDGRVIVPDEPLDLPVNEPLKIRIESEISGAVPVRGTSISELLKFAGTISKEDLAEMSKTIEEGCGRVDKEHWK